MNSSVPRWITASVNKWLSAGTYTSVTYLWYEGADRKILQDKQHWVEVRNSGVLIDDQQGQYELTVLISLVLCVKDSMPDIYLMDRLLGECQARLLNCIPVYNYGDNGILPLTLIGHLALDGNGLKTQKLGVVDTATQLQQAITGGRYCMTINK